MRSTATRLMLAGLLVVPLVANGEVQPAPDVVDLKVDISGNPLAVSEIEGVERNLYLDGRVYVTGQPSQEALVRFRQLGVTAVVNLRTPPEMEDRDRVPFDEGASQ